MLYIASLLTILIGIVHSLLGEKYILIRLFRQDNLPKLLGSDWFTKRVLRFAWHLTTIVWWGFAGILYLLALPSENIETDILWVIFGVFLFSAILAAVASRGKHLSWLVFGSIATICCYVALIN